MKLLAFVLLATIAAGQTSRSIKPLGEGGRRVALVIGNDSYTSVRPLRNARNDAHDMSAVLTASHFQVTTVTDANTEKMQTVANTFVASVHRGDVALFYYSGHAAEIGGQNFLIPVDLSRDLDEIKVRNRALNASEVIEQLEAHGADLQIMILDSCRDNPFRVTRGAGGGGLAAMNVGRGTFIAYATAPGKTADDNPRGGNGMFTGNLVKALKIPGLELRQVFDEAALGTDTDSGRKQVPWVAHSVRGKFYFLGGPVTSGPSQPPVVAAETRPVDPEPINTAPVTGCDLQGIKARLEKEPKNEGLLQRLATCSYEAGQFSAAVLAWNRLIQMNDGNAAYYNGRGLAKLANDSAEGARGDLLTATQREPKNGQYWTDLGRVELQLSNSLEAVKCFDKGIRYGAKTRNNYLGLAEAYEKSGSRDLAAEARQRADQVQ